jgi:hypothetical protein
MDDVPVPIDQASAPLASDLVVACEAVWRRIQSHHPELPPAVMLLGTGMDRGRLVKLGHWWGGRWLADGDIRGEVLLAGEALHYPVEDVFEVLLHEAAHGINAARGLKDTSRGGRYHNVRFKNTAVEVGLDVQQIDPYGFAQTSIRPDTAARYAGEIAHLAGVMRIARRIPATALTESKTEGKERDTSISGRQGGESQRRKVKPAECACGRRMRMAPSVLAQGPVTCGNCGTEFTVDREATRPDDHRDRRSRGLSGPPDQPGQPLGTDPDVEFLNVAANGDDGLEVVLRLGSWRSTFSTENERLVSIDDESHRPRWNQLARAVLSVDGVLQGPEVQLTSGSPLRLGDRVVVSDPPTESSDQEVNLPEAGTAGVVTAVNTVRRSVTVDFPTAGTWEIAADSDEAAALIYDYCEVDPTPTATRLAHTLPPAIDIEPEAEVDLGVEL